MKWVMIAQSVWTLRGVRGRQESEISEKRTSASKWCKSGQDPSAARTWFKGECAGS
ncbi:hypothetical protein Vi05172_g8571 [Venturia inaequalis]|nr:hypothetical protein Vi05172_g8571 [Venturia inaequalis]